MPTTVYQKSNHYNYTCGCLQIENLFIKKSFIRMLDFVVRNAFNLKKKFNIYSNDYYCRMSAFNFAFSFIWENLCIFERCILAGKFTTKFNTHKTQRKLPKDMVTCLRTSILTHSKGVV